MARVVQETYQIIYNSEGHGFTRLRDLTNGGVTLGPCVRWHANKSNIVSFWPRDIRTRDPLERFWAILQNLFAVRSLDEQFKAAFRPKIVPFEVIMYTDRFVPLRNAAPVFCALKHVGTCIALYAEIRWCRAIGAVPQPVPFLVVTPLDPFNGSSGLNREYQGNFWWVPMATCLPLRMAILSWPNVNRSAGIQPDECAVLREDGFQEILNVNYVANEQADLGIRLARIAMYNDNPSAFGIINIPMAATTPERAAKMAPYTLARYIPEAEVPPSKDDDDDEEEEGGGGGDDEEAAATSSPDTEPTIPSVPTTTAAVAAACKEPIGVHMQWD